jgi:hypothetical protein
VALALLFHLDGPLTLWLSDVAPRLATGL